MSRLRAVESFQFAVGSGEHCVRPNSVGIQWVKRRFGISDSGDASERRDMSTALLRVFEHERRLE